MQFEDLRLIDLIKKFQAAVEEINASRNLSKLKDAGRKLQDVYDFFVTAEGEYAEQQEQLKSMFSSFNYAAVIVNSALKSGKLSKEDNELLNECFEIMHKCCTTVCASLQK